MLKNSFLAVFGLLLALAFMTPPKADAQVAIGVTIGGPVYARPIYPYGYGYVRPVYPRPYIYAGPAYYARAYERPYWRGQRFQRREYFEHRGRFDHDRFGRDRYDRGRR